MANILRITLKMVVIIPIKLPMGNIRRMRQQMTDSILRITLEMMVILPIILRMVDIQRIRLHLMDILRITLKNMAIIPILLLITLECMGLLPTKLHMVDIIRQKQHQMMGIFLRIVQVNHLIKVHMVTILQMGLPMMVILGITLAVDTFRITLVMMVTLRLKPLMANSPRKGPLMDIFLKKLNLEIQILGTKPISPLRQLHRITWI